MSVQKTTVVVAMKRSALTPLAALRVTRYVPRDTPVMEGIAWVSQSVIFMFVHSTIIPVSFFFLWICLCYPEYSGFA